MTGCPGFFWPFYKKSLPEFQPYDKAISRCDGPRRIGKLGELGSRESNKPYAMTVHITTNVVIFLIYILSMYLHNKYNDAIHLILQHIRVIGPTQKFSLNMKN